MSKVLQQATYDLFKSGKTTEETIEERGLGISIEGHLARTYPKGIDQAHGYHAIRKAGTLSAIWPSSLLTHKSEGDLWREVYYGDIPVGASLGVGRSVKPAHLRNAKHAIPR
ncbi:MAG: hypothetical protein IPI77_18200 [Saprospiraceae bacterium]|nr:hypothetical protein [Saprospiraceae bacterium]